MLARDIMDTRFHHIYPETTIADAVAAFQQASREENKGIFGLMVTDHHGRLVGMLSMYDILLFIQPKHIHIWGEMDDLDPDQLFEERLDRVMVFTQNVDGLHRMAGSRDLIEIHGNLHHLLCTVCAHEEIVDDLDGRELPPQCPACGGLQRPNVVLFGEALPEAEMTRFIDALQTGFDMVFSIGTSSVFPYIVQPVVYAARSGVPTVEINPSHTPLSEIVSFHLPLGAAAAMRALIQRAGCLAV